MRAITFYTKEEDSDDNNSNINKQQDTKGEESKGGWVLCFFAFLFFGFFFVVGPFLKKFVKPKKKFITKNLVITHNIGFLP